MEDEIRITVRIPGDLNKAIDKWRAAFSREHKVPLGKNASILSLIQRGLDASGK